MIEAEFSELVDLYIDGEISTDQLILLEAELSKNPERRRFFAERWRLHQATRAVLAPNVRDADDGVPLAGGGTPRSPGRTRSARRPQTDKRRQRRKSADTRFYESRVTLPGWIAGTGLVFSVILSIVLLRPVFLDTVDPWALPELVGVHQRDLIDTEKRSEDIRPSDFERYRKRQKAESLQHASLVSQMRLLGLRPEHTPTDKRLQSIHPSLVAPKENPLTQAEFLARMQSIQPMPQPELLQSMRSAQSGLPDGMGFEFRLVGY